MALMRTILSVVGLSLFVYLSHQLTRFSNLNSFETIFTLVVVLAAVGGTIAMPLLFWGESGREIVQRRQGFMAFSYYAMAFFSGLLALVVARDIVAFLAQWFAEDHLLLIYHRDVNFGMMLAAAGIVFVGWLRVKHGPQIKKTFVQDERLPKEFHGLKIVQISDLHISHFVTTEFIQTVLKKVAQAKPDLICLTGDIVDGDPKFIQSKIELLKNLQAPLGVFFVAGNHEYYWKINSILSEIKRLGIVVLENSWQVIHRGQAELLVAGIPDPAARMFGQQGPDWHAFLPALKDSQQYRLVLSHQPHQAKAAAKVGFHLQLSGHTHGGQFFPWNLLIRTAQRYPRGHFKVQDLHLYVNEGTAYWGPAVRFGTKCEITEKVLLHPDENSEIKV